MIHKECNDHFGYGCTLKVDVEDEEELAKYFYRFRTHTGRYFQNVCKTCNKRMHVEMYKKGKYNYTKGRYDKYDKRYSESSFGD